MNIKLDKHRSKSGDYQKEEIDDETSPAKKTTNRRTKRSKKPLIEPSLNDKSIKEISQSQCDLRTSTYVQERRFGENIILKGHLVKKNWYGCKQLRFFELYENGLIKYYTPIKDFTFHHRGDM